MSEWQPFETAPKKHGEDILVADEYGTIALVTYLDASEVIDDDGFISGWYISDWHNDPIWFRGWLELRYWQPLPAPPPH